MLFVFLILVSLSATLYYAGAIIFLARGLHRHNMRGNAQGLTFSIIVAARNEEAMLSRCLDSLFCQSIAPERYEVILINDRSSDRTLAIAESARAVHSNFTILSVQSTPPGIAPKKFALGMGIEKAAGQVLVFTDADCLVPPTWIETFDGFFTPGVGLVQGITTYLPRTDLNQLFFGLQAVDFLSHGIVAAAAIGAGLPINSNANNLAFRREAFADGMTGAVVSGDDDLLLQRVWRNRKWEIRFMTDPAGSVQTEPTPTLGGVLEQRKRWASKTVHYTARQILFLSGIFIFYMMIAGTALAGFIDQRLFGAAGLMLTAKLAGEGALMIPGTRIFDCRMLRPYIAPASLLQLPLVLYAVVAGVFGRFEWKGQRQTRKVRH
jgi:cellulose synthase/poly-beta-1,6-N-acetylglucosamine synthase-like glycosyltransferase